MRTLNAVSGIVTVSAVLGAGWTWHQWRVEREHSADLQRQLTTLRARPAEKAIAAPASPAQPPAVVPSPVATSPGDKAGPTGTTIAYLTKDEARELATRREIAAAMRKSAERERAMLRDPSYRQNQRDEMRQRYAPMRADAIRVGMTPQQADRIVDLEIERNMHFTEIGGVATEMPTESMQSELKRTAEAAQAEQRELLGDDLYSKWSRFQASSQERAEVGLWRAQLTEPINDKQAYAISDSLYVERQRRSNEYEDYVKAAGITDRYTVAPQDRQRWLDLEKEANQRTHDAMAGSLSASQLASLDQMLAARLVPIETALRMQLEGKLAKQD